MRSKFLSGSCLNRRFLMIVMALHCLALVVAITVSEVKQLSPISFRKYSQHVEASFEHFAIYLGFIVQINNICTIKTNLRNVKT